MKVTLQDGTVLTLTQKQYWNTNGSFQHMIAAHSFLRMGDYHLVIGELGLASYMEATPDVKHGWEQEWTETKYRDSFRSDRLQQCLKVEAALAEFPKHPHAQGIREAIKTERNEWAKVGG
jgi:hypothetical protein